MLTLISDNKHTFFYFHVEKSLTKQILGPKLQKLMLYYTIVFPTLETLVQKLIKYKQVCRGVTRMN